MEVYKDQGSQWVRAGHSDELPMQWPVLTGPPASLYIISLRLFVREVHFSRKSVCPMGTKLGTNLCYDEGQLTKQDDVWVMHN